MLCMLPRTVAGWNSLAVTRSTTEASQARDETLQQRDKSKEPPCGWSYGCSRRGEPIVNKREVKQTINVAQLISWIDDPCDKAMSPKTDNIVKRLKGMTAPTMEREASTITNGLKWWRLFRTATEC